LREVQISLLSAIPSHEKPTGKPLFRLVQPVATRDLCSHGSMTLNKLEDAAPNFFRIAKGLLQVRQRNSQTPSS
jgi:hypothetical protein